jgi:hypothetical protein
MNPPPGTTAVWIAPGATRFSCLCERCLDLEGGLGLPALEVLGGANVQGTIPLRANSRTVRCRFGHELVVRRRARRPQTAARPTLTVAG